MAYGFNFSAEGIRVDSLGGKIADVLAEGIQQQIDVLVPHFGGKMLENPFASALAFAFYTKQEEMFIYALGLEAANCSLDGEKKAAAMNLVKSKLEAGLAEILNENYSAIPILGWNGEMQVLDIDYLAKYQAEWPQIATIMGSPEFINCCRLQKLRLMDLCSSAVDAGCEMPAILQDAVTAHISVMYGDPGQLTVADLPAEVAYRFNGRGQINSPFFWLFASRFGKAVRNSLVKVDNNYGGRT